jgi:precorrin isomerase
MRNPKAAWALVTALLALGVLVGGAAAARLMSQVGLVEAVPAVPVGLVLALASLSLGRRARFEHQRTLGRAGGAGLAAAARGLGTIALIVALTAALALAVFAVLTLALD